MEKTSITVKIVSFAVSVIFLLLSLYFFFMAFKAGSYLAIFACVVLATLFFSVPAFFTSIYLSHFTGVKAAKIVYWPGDRVELLPSEYSGIRAKITSGDYYKAIEELEEMIKKDPENHLAVALLSDIYINHIEDYRKSIELLSNFLNRKVRSANDIPFVMKLTDVLLEINEDDKAMRFLDREITLGYSEKEKLPLKKRLEGIVGDRNRMQSTAIVHAAQASK